MMLSVDEALAAVLNELRPLPEMTVALADAFGLVLAKPAISDIDSPPFDKALMDGYAIRSADMSEDSGTLRVLEEITAGHVPTLPVGPGEATRIMTGAPLPPGADTIVRSEDSELASDSQSVRLSFSGTAPGANLLAAGSSIKQGDCLLEPGCLLFAPQLAAMAEVGLATVPVYRRPRVAVLATGDELVLVSEKPGPGQIRNSNETMLVAQIRQSGAEPVPLGIARDDSESIRSGIQAGLECDILVLSGGVSAGTKDLVPAALESAGVRPVFHKVHIRPGKPLWFGVLDRPAADAGQPASRRYVFGLPGNPVSSMVCFELFARTAIRGLMGVAAPKPAPIRARLAENHRATGNRPTYHPSRLEWDKKGPVVRPLNWQGSSDLCATVNANAMTLFPAGEREYLQGETVDVFRWQD